MQEEYLINHLAKYVKFEVEQGYKLGDIKDALLKYGYKKPLVNHVINNLGELRPHKIHKPVKKEMTEEMYFYIQKYVS